MCQRDVIVLAGAAQGQAASDAVSGLRQETVRVLPLPRHGFPRPALDADVPRRTSGQQISAFIATLENDDFLPLWCYFTLWWAIGW